MIVSAQYANAENTAVIIVTDDRGAIAISEEDRPALWAAWQAWPGETAAYVPPDDDAIDMAELNRILVSEGSVMRAIMELMLIEINKLRADHSRPPYTKAQFIAALKAQMRTP